VALIDTVIPMRVLETQGKGKNRRDCMKQFKAAWGRFAEPVIPSVVPRPLKTK
jgi:hypothetical protein